MFLASFSNSISKDPKSLKGTCEKPGMYGPKPRKAVGSLLLEMAARVLPQKLWLAKMTRAFPPSMPLTAYPHRRASLIAVSPPSTPVFMGNTRSYPK